MRGLDWWYGGGVWGVVVVVVVSVGIGVVVVGWVSGDG